MVYTKATTPNINKEDWIVDITCPRCLRPRDVSRNPTIKRGLYYHKEVSLPEYCLYCAMDKKEKEVKK